MAAVSDMGYVLPGDYQHNWSSSIWEGVGAFMGCQGVAQVHFYC